MTLAGVAAGCASSRSAAVATPVAATTQSTVTTFTAPGNHRVQVAFEVKVRPWPYGAQSARRVPHICGNYSVDDPVPLSHYGPDERFCLYAAPDGSAQLIADIGAVASAPNVTQVVTAVRPKAEHVTWVGEAGERVAGRLLETGENTRLAVLAVPLAAWPGRVEVRDADDRLLARTPGRLAARCGGAATCATFSFLSGVPL